jgi:primary-amine oxidase
MVQLGFTMSDNAPVNTSKSPVQRHPFEPLQPDEIKSVVTVLNAAFEGVSLRYKVIDIREPIKSEVIPYIEAERNGSSLPPKPARIAYSLFHRLDTRKLQKALISLDTKRVISVKELPNSIQGPVDIDELIEMEQVCLQHPAVLAEIKKMALPRGITVCTDPWIYGTDDELETRRLTQFYMYLVEVDHPQSNHYSLPCAFSPVFDANTKDLVRMDYLPLGAGHETIETQPWKPVKAVEYAHDLLQEPIRQDLKSYIVQQPDGASFNVSGQLVTWQKWRFRVGFNYREGLVLYNVTYDGRNVFYRLALSEMTVPYGDPRRPFHRKQAFDVGDVGLGITCNQLNLGCDCLGHIKYLSGYRSDSKGNPIHMPNVICLHEEDNGILHKHTNYRNNQATVVRDRQLVVQMICTVSNYEYIFAWKFDLAGGIELEVRATGILSTMPISSDAEVTLPWSTNVGPGVTAPNHQHIFSVRIDPAIDGFQNTVVYEDSVPLSSVSDMEDPFGVGYVAKTTVVDRASFAETNVETARVFKIRNDNIINPISRKPVAYKLQTVASQKMLMSPSSFSQKRAQFTQHDVWVTSYGDDELYAAGEFTNQSQESTGVEQWAARKDNVENSDVVLWHTFGLTHNPRPEDFPVMPSEKMSVHLKPAGFFTKNPALDVPASHQTMNQSVMYEDQPTVQTPNTEATCCAKLKSRM